MAETIPTNNVPLTNAPTYQVWTAQRLHPPEWEAAPYLHVQFLERYAAPQVDRAALEWRYGPILQNDSNEYEVFDPLALVGRFVKIIVYDPTGQVVDIWYGVIEQETNEARGLSISDDISRGTQTFTAFGLLRLLERVVFRSAVKFADGSETERITLARGIPFNLSDSGEYAETKNRSVATSDGVYLFADTPDLAEEWTAWTAAEYLLTHHVPVDGNEVPLATWRLDGEQAILDWYVIHTRTDGRSVKDVLDELIPRKRALGYWIDYDESDNRVHVRLFTLNDQDLILPPRPTGESRTIPGNQDQRALDFERAIVITRAELRNVATTRYDVIIVQGEFKTSTCTLRFNTQRDEIVKSWTGTQETEFLDGASNDPDYGTLDELEKTQRNALVRQSDALFAVFRRFRISETWNQLQPHHFPGQGEEDSRVWHVAPRLDAETGLPLFDGVYFPGVNETGEPLWINDLVLQKRLPLRVGLDYSGDRIQTGEWEEDLSENNRQHLAPLIFTQLEDLPDGTARWYRLEALGLTAAWENDVRRWSGQAEMLSKGAAFDVHIVGGVQQFIALSTWFAAAETDPEHDPEKQGGLDYGDFWATLAIAHDTRVAHRITLSDPVSGVQQRTLVIDVPDARLDYIVPHTVVSLGNSENPVTTTSGGFLRDDRDRLKLIAESAAAWYGKIRQTLSLSFVAVGEVARIGSIITEIPSRFKLENVNTVVTSLRYNFSDPRRVTTELETSFAEFDLF